MSIDAGIYQNIKQFQQPDLLESASRAAQLSQYARQNRKLDQEEERQKAIKDVLAKNIGEDGMVSTSGLSQYAKLDPIAAMEYQKNQLGLQTSKLDAQEKIHAAAGPGFDYLASLPKEQRAAAYPTVYQDWKNKGLPTDKIPTPDQYDEMWFQPAYRQFSSSVAGLKMQKDKLGIDKDKSDLRKSEADTAKSWAEVGKIKNENKEGKVPNKDQFQAATFGTRAAQAEDVFSQLAQKGFDPTTTGNSIRRNFPGWLEGNKGGDIKSLEQAQRNFVNAILRRESGAAISESEFDNARSQYFPSYGDTPEVLQQKEQNRKTAIAALNAEGAPAMSRLAKSMNGMAVASSIPKNNTKNQNIAGGQEVVASEMPKHGTVEDGYIFMGGDPANPKSWMRVK